MAAVSEISARKLEANRRNALKSTGPRTAEGKARISQNAATHGVFRRQLLAEGDDPRELAELELELVRDLRPRNSVERMLVDQIISANWKLRRLQAAEQALFREQADELRKKRPARDFADGIIPAGHCLTRLIAAQGEMADRYSVYEQRLQRTIHRCLRELRQLRKQADAIDERHDAVNTSPQPCDVNVEEQRTGDNGPLTNLQNKPIASAGRGDTTAWKRDDATAIVDRARGTDTMDWKKPHSDDGPRSLSGLACEANKNDFAG